MTAHIDHVKLTYTMPATQFYVADNLSRKERFGIRHSQSLSRPVSVGNYSPFGVTLNKRDLSLTSGSGVLPYRYGYQGSEMDNEVKDGGNSYTTEFRQLDPRLGRWLSIDPKNAKTPWESPYVSMGDNPLIYNDSKGDTLYYFNSDGTYLKTEPNEYVNGVEGVNGIKIMDTKNFRMYSDNIESVEYAFNDQKLDGKRMEQGIKEYGSTKPLVIIKSATNIAAYVQDACGDKIKWSYNGKLSWAKRNSTGGNLDFWNSYLAPELLKNGYNNNVAYERTDAGPFYIFNGAPVAYNIMDAGNFLWGKAMRTLGFSLEAAKFGEMLNDPKDPMSDRMAVEDGHKNDPVYTKKVGTPIKRNDPNQYVKYDKSKSKSSGSSASGGSRW